MLIHAQEEYEATRKLRGDDDPTTLLAMKRLALAYADEGDLAKACSLLTTVLTKQRQGNDDKLSDSAETAHYLGVMLYKIGDYLSARAVQEEVLFRIIERDGQSSDAALVALYNLGVTLVALGAFTALISIGNPLVDARLSSNRRDTPIVLHHVHWLAGWWRHLGEFRRASKMYKRVIQKGVRHVHKNFPVIFKSVLAEIFLMPPGLLLLKINPDVETSELRRRAVMRYENKKV